MHQLNRSLLVTLALLIGLALFVPHSYAGLILYQTGFEPPTFSPGVLIGQDGWVGPLTGPFVGLLSPNAAVVSTAQPKIGTQSVLVPGADLVHQDFINQVTSGYYDSIGSYRQPVNYDTGGTQIIRLSAMVRVDGPSTPGTNFFSASIAAIGDSGLGIGELAISSDGQVHAYSGDDPVPSFVSSAPVTLGAWHTLAVEANFAANRTSFFVDDNFLGSLDFVGDAMNLFLRGSMVTYAAPDTETEHKGDYSAHFDDFVIEVVPLPSSLLLFGSSLLGLMGWRKFKQS